MSNQEFENYIALMGKLLQLSKDQRDQISGELQDHMQMRVADLMSEGVGQHEAVSQALDEFGDVAVMAKNFQSVINLKKRRWMMRFATLSIAGLFLAAVLTMALWPDNARFGTPTLSIAQSSSQDKADDEKDIGPQLSPGTMREILAEEKLKEIVDLNYDETPFSEIQEELSAKTGLNFLLNSSAQDDSLTEDEPITVNLKGIPLNRGLKMMLEIKNATYIIDSGVIVIISLDDAEDVKWFRLKMYDCKELVRVLPKRLTSQLVIGGQGGGGLGGAGGGLFSVQEPPIEKKTEGKISTDQQPDSSKLIDQKLEKLMAMMKAEAKKNRAVPTSENTLLDLVTSMVHPDSWNSTGQGLGEIKVVNGVLIVSHSEEVHGAIESLLTDLESNIFAGGKNGVEALLKKHNQELTGSRLGRIPEKHPEGK